MSAAVYSAALQHEERSAAAEPGPEAYRALLERRLAGTPVLVDLALLERVLAEKPWADALRPLAGPLLVQTGSRADSVVFVNTFPRVPTAAAEAVLVQALRLRRGSLHTPNAGFDLAFDRLTALREFRARSLIRGHVTATVRVRACIALLAIRPIVLVRDIFDTIASYAADRGYPMMFPGYRLDGFGIADRQRMQTMRMAVQLVDFYASWMAAQQAGLCTVLRWEDVHLDWPSFLVDRLAEHGQRRDRATIVDQMAALPPDPNAGPGLGSGMSDECRFLVRSLYAQYPALDFRPIDAGAPAPG